MWYSILLNVCYQQFNAFGVSNKHTNGLLLDIVYSYTSCKYVLDYMVSIRSKLRKVGHDLDLEFSL